MIVCPGCAKNNSPYNALCPDCGHLIAWHRPAWMKTGGFPLGLVLCATGVMFFLLVVYMMGTSELNTARRGASFGDERELLERAEPWVAAHPGACPTLADLGQPKRVDPWGRPYRIECRGEVRVTSNGPDGKSNTPDDTWEPYPIFVGK